MILKIVSFTDRRYQNFVCILFDIKFSEIVYYVMFTICVVPNILMFHIHIISIRKIVPLVARSYGNVQKTPRLFEEE